MKKYFTAGFVAISLAVAVPTVNAHTTGAGCGLGKLALNGKSGLGWNVLAFFLNGTGVNTFAMSSGTSDCDVTKTVRNETDRTEYAAINFDNLSADAARGAGEHLAGLAQVMTIAEADRTSFYTLMQSRYDNLFSQTATPESMLVSLDDAMRADAHLAQYVR
jgi:hypothetical protein